MYLLMEPVQSVCHKVVTRESDMNELQDELCCLCRLLISKDLRKRKRFHGTSCTKANTLANLTTSLVSQT